MKSWQPVHVGSKVNVVLTLRGDFVGKALAYRPLSDRLQGAQINLGPMIREELECAIRNPAEKIQLEFEAGLVSRILNDVGKSLATYRFWNLYLRSFGKIATVASNGGSCARGFDFKLEHPARLGE
jgi:hypothetical protein